MKFERKKFLAVPPERQHKKCLELLRDLYHEMTSWMGLPLVALETPEDIADKFHYHKEMARISIREHELLPHMQVKTLDNEEGDDYLPICIYLDKLRSAHNIGSIIRTTEAFRLGTIYFSEGMATKENLQVQKTSMGCQDWVQCKENISLHMLQRPIIALETIPTALPYSDFQFPDTFTLVVGNEELGCSQRTLDLADHYIQIPLRGKKNSVNVASAFAIIAAEISRQKRSPKHAKA